MVVSNNGLTVYLGSSTALMVLSAINQLSISRTDITSPGTVLALSPDGSTLVISDPIHQVIELENSSGGVLTTYGGVGTHAEFTPDSQTVYITAGDQLLVYSENSGWTSISPATPEGTAVEDVAVTVPSVGAYFAGPRTTARGYCSSSTPTAQTGTENNVFFPLAYDSATVTDRIAATNDGMHILGATVTGGAIFNDLKVSIPSGNANGTATSVACPMVGGLSFSSVPTPTTLAGVTADCGFDRGLCDLYGVGRDTSGLCASDWTDELRQALGDGDGADLGRDERGQLDAVRGDFRRQPCAPDHDEGRAGRFVDDCAEPGGCAGAERSGGNGCAGKSDRAEGAHDDLGCGCPGQG
jgi:hypothetical protein